MFSTPEDNGELKEQSVRAESLDSYTTFHFGFKDFWDKIQEPVKHEFFMLS